MLVDYSQSAGKYNDRAGDNEAAFDKSLQNAKAELVTCCKDGGSATCADDAK